jgi:electron transfer flavoprotein beta subunit
VKLPDIIKAKKKPLETLTLEALGVQLEPKLRTVKLTAPPVRGRGRMLQTADELVAELAQRNLLP